MTLGATTDGLIRGACPACGHVATAHLFPSGKTHPTDRFVSGVRP